MRVLAIEPYYGGSHQAFLDAVVRHSRHEWTLVTGLARHWKWRMRNAPLTMAVQAKRTLHSDSQLGNANFDLIFASDMLDLPQWRGFMVDSPHIAPEIPSVIYFHENQWTYPTANKARADFHYGYTNLLTAVAASEVWFNSHHHLNAFYHASGQFLARMPDSTAVHTLDQLREKSIVIPAGFESFEPNQARWSIESNPRPITLGWVSRWEDDKRPDRFLNLLDQLSDNGVPFQLVLLGARPRNPPPALTAIRERHTKSILHDGFASDDCTGDDCTGKNVTKESYLDWLSQIDVVVSTADHEFFGIAVCEAIWAGAIPMLPNRLSYPELASKESLYETLEEAATRIASIAGTTIRQRRTRSDTARQRIVDYQMSTIVPKLDARIDRLTSPA